MTTLTVGGDEEGDNAAQRPGGWGVLVAWLCDKEEGKSVNCGLSKIFGALCEAAREPNQSSSDLCDSAGSYIRAGSAMFFAEPEGELTLGSAAAFAAGSVWRGFRAIQSNTPSVSRQKQAADTSDVTTSRIARNQRFRLPGRLREGGYKDKS